MILHSDVFMKHFYFWTIPPPSPSLAKRTNIRTYSAHWTSLRALLWMADVFSQTCKECTSVCSSDKGPCTLTQNRVYMPNGACTKRKDKTLESLSRSLRLREADFFFLCQSRLYFVYSFSNVHRVHAFIVHVHTPWRRVQAFFLVLT